MKITVTARGPTPDSPVDERFGRAYWLLVYDEQTDGWEAVDNAEARNAVQGAGIRAAQEVAARGVGAVLTGVTGPKAYRALDAAGIAVYHGIRGTARDAVAAWRAGRLDRAAAGDALGRP